MQGRIKKVYTSSRGNREKVQGILYSLSNIYRRKGGYKRHATRNKLGLFVTQQHKHHPQIAKSLRWNSSTRERHLVIDLIRAATSERRHQTSHPIRTDHVFGGHLLASRFTPKRYTTVPEPRLLLRRSGVGKAAPCQAKLGCTKMRFVRKFIAATCYKATQQQ